MDFHYCLYYLKYNVEPGTVAYVCNPTTQKIDAGRSQVSDQPELHGKTLSKKPNK
jgi:hypothetical protein